MGLNKVQCIFVYSASLSGLNTYQCNSSLLKIDLCVVSAAKSAIRYHSLIHHCVLCTVDRLELGVGTI